MAKRKSAVSEEEMTQIFQKADLDDDGYLTYKEAKKAYKKVAKLLRRPTDQVSMASYNVPKSVLTKVYGVPL